VRQPAACYSWLGTAGQPGLKTLKSAIVIIIVAELELPEPEPHHFGKAGAVKERIYKKYGLLPSKYNHKKS
jgi:hypothetical protein